LGRIPEDTIQTIRDRIDIVDLVGRYVNLKKAGRSFKGLCPFHQEKTPSFVVTPDRGTYHCFGCGEGGNAFAFLMRHENLTFPEAVRLLAGEIGVEVPESGGGDRGVVEQVLRANDTALAYFRGALQAEHGSGARTYLSARGLSGEDAEAFHIGFAPDRWDGMVGVLRREEISPEVGLTAGLLKARDRGGHYDLLRGRVVFPIQDARGRIVAFGGRAMGDGEPKYLNSPESPVFRKRESFYGFPHALEPMRRNDRAVVVEGYFDRIALHRAGIPEAVATCGTALTDEHARNLRRRTRNVVLLFDGDAAGQRAMLRALEVLLPAELRVRAAALPGGVDPDDFLRERGAEALARLVDEAPPAIEVAIQRAVESGCATPWERADAVGEVAPLLALIPEPVERGEFSRRLAMALGVEPANVEAAVRLARRGGAEPEAALEPAPARQRPLTLDERRFAEALGLLVDHPESAERLSAERLLAAAPEPGQQTLAGILHERAAAGRLDVAALLDELSPEQGAPLSALVSAARAGAPDVERAVRAIEDTLHWLEARRQREAHRSLTRELAASADPNRQASYLTEKQRQLEERRAQRGVPPG
jgi:DNA primase